MMASTARFVQVMSLHNPLQNKEPVLIRVWTKETVLISRREVNMTAKERACANNTRTNLQCEF